MKAFSSTTGHVQKRVSPCDSFAIAWKLYGNGQLFDVKHDVREQTPVTGPGSNTIRQQLQSALDRMPTEGQTLLKFD